jgi:hypothetical protein
VPEGVPPTAGAAGRERRTVAIAAIAMLALVVSGVVAGALFAASGCRELRPRPLETTTVAPVALADDVGAALPALTAALAAGRPAGPDAALVRVDVAAGRRLVALEAGIAVVDGPDERPTTLTVLDDEGAVRSVTRFGPATTVVGGAPAPYALEVPNRATGQVDALAALEVTLTGVTAGVCVDTAVVGSPLAFLLDAGGGRLLLLRTAEDGSDVDVELRDPRLGRVWAARLDLPQAPAGLVAARTSAVLGRSLVVVGHRGDPTAPAPAGPVVVGLSTADGDVRWVLDAAALGRALDGAPEGVAPSGPFDVEVVAVGQDVVALLVVAVTDPTALAAPAWGPLGGPEERAARRGALVTLDAADGSVLAVRAPARPEEVRRARDAAGGEGERRELVARALGDAVRDVVVTTGRVWVLLGPADPSAGGAVVVGLPS